MIGLKAGTETGSLINHLQSRMVKGSPMPEVGMGATVLLWSDRSPATVTLVAKKGSNFLVQIREDEAKLVSGSEYSGDAKYEYSAREDGTPSHYRGSPTTGWVPVRYNAETKRWNKVDAGGVIFGVREKYRDPSF